MKKAIILAAVALGITTAQAQTTVAGSRFTDNWSFTLKGGAVMPSKGTAENGFWKDGRGLVGVELRKQVTPVFGLGLECQQLFMVWVEIGQCVRPPVCWCFRCS